MMIAKQKCRELNMTGGQTGFTRDVPLEPGRAALLIVDVQKYCCERSGNAFDGMDEAYFESKYGDYFRRKSFLHAK